MYYAGLIEANLVDRPSRRFSVSTAAPSQELAIENAMEAVERRLVHLYHEEIADLYPIGWAEVHPDFSISVNEI